MNKTNKAIKASIKMSMKNKLEIGHSTRGNMLRKGELEYVFTEDNWEGRRRSLQVHHSANLRIVHHPDGYYRICIKVADELIHHGAAPLIRERAEKAISVLENRRDSVQIQLGFIILPKSA